MSMIHPSIQPEPSPDKPQLLAQVVAALPEAYRWLCHQRRHFPANASVWDLRFHWSEAFPQIRQSLLNRLFHFGPMKTLERTDGSVIHLWEARDVLVLKALALVIEPMLEILPACTHVRGHGDLHRSHRKGLHFLGYAFSRQPMTLAKQTIERYAARRHRLYERQIKKKATPNEVALILDAYAKRWRRWCTAGLTPLDGQILIPTNITLALCLNMTATQGHEYTQAG